MQLSRLQIKIKIDPRFFLVWVHTCIILQLVCIRSNSSDMTSHWGQFNEMQEWKLKISLDEDDAKCTNIIRLFVQSKLRGLLKCLWLSIYCIWWEISPWFISGICPLHQIGSQALLWRKKVKIIIKEKKLKQIFFVLKL